LKRVVPQESQLDSHSPSLSGSQVEMSGGYRRVQTSAAMLGIALSFGAPASLLAEPELALAADGSTLKVLPSSSQASSQFAELPTDQGARSSAYHTVAPGESLWQIAASHKADVQAIKIANSIVSEEVLRVGQVIRVPAVGMANLANDSEGSRLALKLEAGGSVGGDMVAIGTIPAAPVVPLVDDLEKVWELEASLSDDAELSDDELAAQLEQDKISSTAAFPTVESESSAAVGDAPQDLSAQLALVPQSPKIDDQWSVAEAQSPQPLVAATAIAPEPPIASNVASPPPESESFVPVASLPLHEEPVTAVQPQRSSPGAASPETTSPEATSPEATGDSVAKKDLVATLPSVSATRQVPSAAANIRTYQVKPGDTLWSIAARNGLTLQELLSHNQAVSQPETLAVGDSLSLPATIANADLVEVAEPAAASTSTLAVAPRTREQVIRDHLARIRETNNTSIDRDELNARIRDARAELARSRGEDISPVAAPEAVSLEYHVPEPVALVANSVGGVEPTEASSALMAREGTEASLSDWTVTDVAEAEALQNEAVKDEPQRIAALSPATAVTVEEQSFRDGALTPNNLLAAAPLGADAYRITPNLPVGQSVTPGMPMMPGASEFLPEAPALSNGYVWPTQGTFTSGYGWRWGRMHRGIDIAGPVGTPIVAAASGVVVRSGWNSGGYGNLVDIRHPDGSMTRYAHNSRLLVREGEQVRQGQQIAAMGSTGYSTGPHLHFEVHLPSAGTVNPMAYLPGR
jgi:murein DD-endopeptidase MepM/ murein hydrolase activator NlpD